MINGVLHNISGKIEIINLVHSAIKIAQEHNYDKSSKLYAKIFKMCSDNAFIFYQYGLFCETTGDVKKAINELTEAIKLAPKIAAIYYDRGTMFQSIDHFDFAIDDFTKAIEIYPHFLDAFHNRGVSYFHQGKKQLAILDFEAALKIDPTDENSLENLRVIKTN